MESILYKLPPSGKSIIGLNAVEWVKKFTTINKKAKLMPIPTQKPCRFKRPLKLNKSWSKPILFLMFIILTKNIVIHGGGIIA